MRPLPCILLIVLCFLVLISWTPLAVDASYRTWLQSEVTRGGGGICRNLYLFLFKKQNKTNKKKTEVLFSNGSHGTLRLAKAISDTDPMQ